MPAALDRQLTAAYRALLEERFGLRLSDQQSEQLNEVVPQLLAMTRYAGPGELVQAFASGWRADLLQALATSMTVGETHFFRVPAQIRALEQIILPDLIARHAVDKRLRIWSAARQRRRGGGHHPPLRVHPLSATSPAPADGSAVIRKTATADA